LTVSLDLNVYDLTRQSQDFTAYLDTQADSNFISQSSVQFLGHEIHPYEGRSFTGAGTTVTPLGTADIFFRWKSSATKKLHIEKFLVLEDIPYDLILGNSFLDKNQVYVFNGSLLPLALKPPSDGSVIPFPPLSYRP